MHPVRTHLLINQQKFSPPLKRALADRGLVLVDNERNPSPDLLQRTLASIVGFDVCNIKHPIKARMWRSRMSRHGVPVFTWNRDAPYHNNLPAWRLSIFSRARPLDIYATHSLIDSRWSFADTTLFLPNAADTTNYNVGCDPEAMFSRLRQSACYRWDVSFFGTLLSGHYGKEVVARQRFFAALVPRLDALGISHRIVDLAKTPLSLAEQIELIQTSRINLNVGAYCDYCNTRTYPAAGLPERCFGVPASGGFLLTDRRTHMADSFEIGCHFDDFADIDECVTKILIYLENFGRSREIAEACWHHVMRYHTYEKRAETLHQALLDWHAARSQPLKVDGGLLGAT